jgi:hypothetical protein
MAVKSKRSLSKTAIIVLVGLLVVAGLFMWGRSTKSDHKTAVIPNASSSPAPSSSSSTPTPAAGLGSLPQAPGGAASQGAAGQATPIPGAPVASTATGHEGAYPLKPGDSDSTSCSWSAGTTCYIIFTSQDGNTVLRLPSKTIPASGTATWNWKVGSGTDNANLTQGQWTVQAVGVSNNKQVLSTPEVIFVNS